MRPFDIAKVATFSLETFYYLLSIALHTSMLIENQNYAIIMHKMFRKNTSRSLWIERAGESVQAIAAYGGGLEFYLIGTLKYLPTSGNATFHAEE